VSDFWNIAVNVPLHEPLTYATPLELSGTLKRGMLVDVPLGTKKGVKGLLLSPADKAPEGFAVKAIQNIDPEYQVLPDSHVRWIEWLAHYYVHPIGNVMTSAYPPLSRTTTQRKSNRPPVVPVLESKGALDLTAQQQEAFDAIRKSSGFSTHLLFGVTGSGKTEVYLRLLQEILEQGKQGLVLVPEISLTPQLVHRFAERFGDQIAVLHSQLTDRERTNQWWEMVEGRKKILIGARSALFCPLPNLGLIIVDEEHEPSYKQEEKLKYHGRDAAVMLGKFANCPVVLGSATPSLESWKNAIEGRYHLHRMSQRVQDRALPTVEVLDLRTMEKDPALPFWLSPTLHQAIHETLEKKEQVALFLNRRGVANVVLCPGCGFTHECPNCDITLTLHGRHHLVCHYCDYHEEYKLDCPSCKIGEVTPVGLGTELLETEMQRLFPEAKIARADRDEIQNRHDLEELVRGMESGDTDILIGTQMIAKGLDFPRLNLVGLVLADIGFNLPDFRATERSFQLITQVSGRAGRHVKPGEPPGRVIVQTYNPDHPSLTFAQKHDFESFSQMEIAQREPLAYPPIGKLISFRIQGTQLVRVQEAARLLSVRSQQLKNKHAAYENVEVLGPAEAPLAKLRGQYRYHLLLKGKDHRHLQSFCRQVLGDQKWLPPAVRISVDVDPLQLL
jgi:primosomal protein N' (replication factor Y) (superfamily II helicase)